MPLAEELFEFVGLRVKKSRQRLKTLMNELQRERGTVRAATESLLAHMEGLMRQVARKLSHAGTYGPQGAVGAGNQQVVSGLDVTH